MKKQKYYLAASVLACSAISGLAMPLANTFAEGDLSGGSHDVTVGEVDETEYNVEISWGDMTFDWKYDYSANTFSFANRITCSELALVGSPDGEEPPVVPSSYFDYNLFQDDACTEPATAPYSAPLYANLSNLSTIDVTDSTANGRVKARASFNPEDNYSWVTGRFSSIAHIDNNNNFSQDLDGGYLEAVAASQGSRFLNGVLYLEGDNTHITSDAVHAGDKIGTVTITIEPDLN